MRSTTTMQMLIAGLEQQIDRLIEEDEPDMAQIKALRAEIKALREQAAAAPEPEPAQEPAPTPEPAPLQREIKRREGFEPHNGDDPHTAARRAAGMAALALPGIVEVEEAGVWLWLTGYTAGDAAHALRDQLKALGFEFDFKKTEARTDGLSVWYWPDPDSRGKRRRGRYTTLEQVYQKHGARRLDDER